MKVILKKTSEIKPYDKNPRLNQEAIDAVAKSIAEYGFLNPLTICPDGTLVRGHTRWEAAKKLNLSHVPVLIADNMTEDEIRAFRIADNKVAEGATWDYAALMEEIKDIQQENRDLNLLGFATDILENLLNSNDENAIEDGETDPELIPEVEESDSKRGCIYSLGEHRIICGTDIRKLCGGMSAKMLWYDYRQSNDLNHLMESIRIVSDDGALYIPCNHADMFFVAQIMQECDIEHLEHLLLIPGQMNPSGDYYKNSSYGMLYGVRNWKRHKWHGDKKRDNLMEFDTEFEIPIRDITQILQHSTVRGDVILDGNCSFGSLIIASDQVGRICYAACHDENSCDIARKRWAEFRHGEGCDWKLLTPAI